MFKQAGQKLAGPCDVHVNEVRFLESLLANTSARLHQEAAELHRRKSFSDTSSTQNSIKTLQLEKVQQDLSKLSFKR